MDHLITRRSFLMRSVLASAVAATIPDSLFAEKTRNIQIGHTGITWMNAQVEDAIRSVGKLGFYGFETFGEVLDSWEPKGGLQPVFRQSKIPLISGYCTLNLTDTEKRQEQITKAVACAKLIKKYNGRVFVLGPNQVHRASYDFSANKANIVSTLNEAAKAISDQGITPVLHQHTGTCVETRDETYATLDAIDTRHLKFGPDVGQLTKGGADAVKVVKDYLPLVQHMHLKDFNGEDDHLLGYCPLGKGRVNVRGILDLMNGRKISGMVMVELDNNPKSPSPVPPEDLVAQSKSYLKTTGVKFRV
ncbi:MAG: sugar phosphate isomerase/epimerase family protein [Edaphobacter sp.]